MPADPDVSTSFAGWIPELELGDVAGRLQNIYTYLSRLDGWLSSTTPSSQLTRLEVNSCALGRAITETIHQVQRQDSLDIGDPDINEEVIGTLRSILISVSALSRARSLSEAAIEVDEVKEAITDLAEYVANY